MAYSEKVMDHFANPRNVGEIENADGIGEVGNSKCGDIMKMYIKVDNDIITDVKFKTFGCGAAIATSSMATELIKGKSINDVLEMSVEEGMEFFSNIPKIYRKLKTLYEVGLGYIKLGQPATTLSGGEAQRVKLATELSKRSTGKTIYILDEPTTGLHIADVHLSLIHI